MDRQTHKLKTKPEFFRAIWQGRKRAELRLNDRNYRRNDCLHLQEYDLATRTYSGDYVIALITDVTEFPDALNPGWVMLSFETAVCVERDLTASVKLKRIRDVIEEADKSPHQLDIRNAVVDILND